MPFYCFLTVFVVLFLLYSLAVFCTLMTFCSVMFGFLSIYFLYIYCRFLICCYHVLCIYQGMFIAVYFQLSALWVCLLWRWLGGALVWPGTCHQVRWSWTLLGGDLLQAKVSLHLCPIWATSGMPLVLGLEALGRWYAANPNQLGTTTM